MLMRLIHSSLEAGINNFTSPNVMEQESLPLGSDLGAIRIDFTPVQFIAKNLISIIRLPSAMKGVFIIDPNEEHNIRSDIGRFGGWDDSEEQAILLEDIDGFVILRQILTKIEVKGIGHDFLHRR